MKPSKAMIVGMIGAMVATGCLSLDAERPAPKDYDLGPVAAMSATPLDKTGFFLNIARVPEAIDSRDMLYRLVYNDPNRVSSYTESRWRVTPAQLITNRLSQTSGMLVRGRSTQVVLGTCSVDLSVSVFEQRFSSPNAGEALVDWTVTVTDTQTRNRLGQKQIAKSRPLTSPDAKGGAAALSQATDEAIAETVKWLSNDMLSQNPVCGRPNRS